MKRVSWRRAFGWLTMASAGLLYQSSCPIGENFDPALLFSNVASTLITDGLFFIFDNALFQLT
ncbi:MAG: hypothetical protein HJJLKODD_00862 [Phycisphaerae bacterium]|nr:hypothetical protein [Phycisphaerae bacterium]